MVILLFVVSAAVSLFSLSTLTPMPTPAPTPPAPTTTPSVLSLLPCFANTSTESAVILTPATLAVVLPSKSVTLVAFETPAPIPAAPKPTVSEEMPCCASASTLNAPALITESALPSLSVLPTTSAVTSRLTVLVSLPRPTPPPIPATLALPTSPALLV